MRLNELSENIITSALFKHGQELHYDKTYSEGSIVTNSMAMAAFDILNRDLYLRLHLDLTFHSLSSNMVISN